MKRNMIVAGISFGLFALVPISENNDIFLKTALNYLNDNVSASNGSIDFTRFPIDLLITKQGEKLPFGAGLTYHLTPEYDSSFSGFNTTADNALGLILEANYKIFSQAHIGLRYTHIKYKFANEYDGSNTTITAGYTF